jgi:hypothetical protein
MAYADPNPPRSYYKSKDGLFCGYAVNSDPHTNRVALQMRDGCSWFSYDELVSIPKAEALNLW